MFFLDLLFVLLFMTFTCCGFYTRVLFIIIIQFSFVDACYTAYPEICCEMSNSAHPSQMLKCQEPNVWIWLPNGQKYLKLVPPYENLEKIWSILLFQIVWKWYRENLYQLLSEWKFHLAKKVGAMTPASPSCVGPA